MATREPRILKDGLLSALKGMDSGRNPALIDQDQVAYGHNVTMRGGYIDSRPGFVTRTLSFVDDEDEEWFQYRALQGTGTYLASDGIRYLIAVAGGRIFRVEPDTWKVLDLTPKFSPTVLNGAWDTTGDTDMDFVVDSVDRMYVGYPVWVGDCKFSISAVDSTTKAITVTRVSGTTEVFADDSQVWTLDIGRHDVASAWVCQAANWLIVQDDISAAFLYDGSQSHRANTLGAKPEVPTGRSMAYVNGRLWVQVDDHEIAAGDILGGPTNVVTFSEEKFLAEGGRFHSDDVITGLFSSTNVDTGTGQGPVLIFTLQRVLAINVPVNRELWKDLNYPIQTVLVAHGGATGAYSLTQVNGDVFYLSPDGVRSMMLSRREVGEWGQVPVSGELERIFKEQNRTLNSRASAILLDNRLLLTVSPVSTCLGVIHRGLVALDFSPISRMGGKASPAWEGVWTGVYFTMLIGGLFNGEDRGFSWIQSADDNSAPINALMEIRNEYHSDNNNTRIQSFVESRSLPFNNPTELKRLQGFELWVDQVEGTVDFDLRWRPDQQPCWNVWATKQICVTIEQCSWDCEDISNLKPGYRTRLGFGRPDDSTCDTLDNKSPILGYEHQLRLAWTGKARVRKFVAKAQIEEEYPFAPCD